MNIIEGIETIYGADNNICRENKEENTWFFVGKKTGIVYVWNEEDPNTVYYHNAGWEDNPALEEWVPGELIGSMSRDDLITGDRGNLALVVDLVRMSEDILQG